MSVCPPMLAFICRVQLSAMKILLFIVSFIHLTSARFLVSEQVLKIVYGDIGSMRDLQVPPRNERRSMPRPVSNEDQHRLPEFHEFLQELEEIPMRLKINSSTDFYIKDLNDVTKQVADVKKNVKEVIKDHEATRRQNTKIELPPSEIAELYRYPAKLREWYYMKLCLSFLIHIRFQVDAAVRYKMASVGFRGYKIGYLFHRLTSLREQMTRVMEEWTVIKTNRLVQNRPNWRTKKHDLALTLRLFQRMIELDVDVKDTVDMIKLIFYGKPAFQTKLDTPTTPILQRK